MRKISTAVLIGILAGFLLAGTASAHSRYLRSDPGTDAIIATPPSQVDIWFTGELFRRKGENTIRVVGPDGQQASTGETEIDDNDRTHIWINLRSDLSAGKYLVEWKNVSLEDGHPEEGSFSFTIDPQAVVTSTPMGLTPPSISTAITVPAVTPQTGGPCTSGIVPVGGMVAFGIVRRLRRK
jgi:methionine-rich copper-binding protein CopC